MTYLNLKNIIFPVFCISLILLIATCNGGSVYSSSDSIQVKTNSLQAETGLSGMIKPKEPKPVWAPDIHPEMLAVIESW
jgi:hypothetical protein